MNTTQRPKVRTAAGRTTTPEASRRNGAALTQLRGRARPWGKTGKAVRSSGNARAIRESQS